MKNKLIVALDTDDGEEIDWITDMLMGTVVWVKVGFQAITTVGTEVFSWMSERRFKTFS